MYNLVNNFASKVCEMKYLVYSIESDALEFITAYKESPITQTEIRRELSQKIEEELFFAFLVNQLAFSTIT